MYLQNTVNETGAPVKFCDPGIVTNNRDVTGFLQVNSI